MNTVGAPGVFDLGDVGIGGHIGIVNHADFRLPESGVLQSGGQFGGNGLHQAAMRLHQPFRAESASGAARPKIGPDRNAQPTKDLLERQGAV